MTNEINQPPPNIPFDPPPPVVTPTPVKPKRDLSLYLIIGSIVAFLIIVIVGLAVGISLINSPKKYTPTPKPNPIATSSPTINPVISKYASDSGLLKIQGDLKTLGADVDSVDLFEPQLSPPNLDLNIHIK